jgi:hypothetical protein
MAKQTKAEIAFRARYPNARVFVGRVVLIRSRYTILAGDYLCAEGPTVALAFREALRQDDAGNIKPDPSEVAHTAVGVGHCEVCGHHGSDCTGAPEHKSATFEKALKRFFIGGYDSAQHRTAPDLAWAMLHELDLYEEGEENELPTAKLRARAKAFVAEFGDDYMKSEAEKKK